MDKTHDLVLRSLPNGIALLELEGELDFYASLDLTERFERLSVQNPWSQGLILNLGRVYTMDSSGLGFIVGVYRSVHRAGGRMAVVTANPGVRRLLHLASAGRMFAMADTTGEALQRLQEDPARASEVSAE